MSLHPIIRNVIIFAYDLPITCCFTVRDEVSLDKLKEMGIRKPVALTADPSLILTLPGAVEGRRALSLEGIPTGKPLLGVSVRSIPHRPDLEDKLFPVLAEALDNLAKDFNFQPVFILFQYPEDMREASKVIALMKESSSVIFRICRPHEILALISQFDLLIGMRLHSLIFAAMNAVQMLGISYDPKVEAFMKSVEQPCLDVNRELGAEALRRKLSEVIADKEKIKNVLTNKKQILQQKAQFNFELLEEIVTGK